ncbi:unnamed protein product [Clavelina lepadiformis]|uniref:Uncharacterized protein n=1 Tax=Clavelina lepadiformis TaxID=159417 RepID=A0ABP0FTV1_CLALP
MTSTKRQHEMQQPRFRSWSPFRGEIWASGYSDSYQILSGVYSSQRARLTYVTMTLLRQNTQTAQRKVSIQCLRDVINRYSNPDNPIRHPFSTCRCFSQM